MAVTDYSNTIPERLVNLLYQLLSGKSIFSRKREK
nr:MAG TPA: hypothetical protein [Caudoviricetes sp.]